MEVEGFSQLISCDVSNDFNPLKLVYYKIL